jgi:hypothetical protein
VKKINKEGFQLYVVEKRANSVDMGIYLFALDLSVKKVTGRGPKGSARFQEGEIADALAHSLGPACSATKTTLAIYWVTPNPAIRRTNHGKCDSCVFNRRLFESRTWSP